jgi:hypothetical protein
VKALVVRRPWVELITSGVKDVENRGRYTAYRGPLLVVGGLVWDPYGLEYAAQLGVDISPNPDDHPTGAVAVVNLYDVCNLRDVPYVCLCRSQWAQAGQHHWRLTDPRRLTEPIPVRGMPGMFTPPADVTAAVLAQLELEGLSR